MRALLVSTYDLGRQPLGLASPAASLRQAGVEVACVDTSRDTLEDETIASAAFVAFYLPMHTATRLAAPLIERVRAANPAATLAAYGLYAPLNRQWLHERGVAHVLGPDAESDLVALIAHGESPVANSRRLTLLPPDRSLLPPLPRYAALQMQDGTRRVVGSTDTTRGCKHLCRHCPIVPVYRGRFTAVPVDIVMADVRAQVAAGAQHISFGDPDFFNGPTHARRVVERLAHELPGITYDATIKIEHLLKHADMLPLLRDTGCLFVTSAVESVDDDVLAKLRKGHTRAAFARAVEVCRAAGVALSPTFVAFTPWTTIAGYADLLEQIEVLGLVEAVAPIQLAIRLLVTADSALLDLPEIRESVRAFDPQSLTYPWTHVDPRVDALQQQVMAIVARMAGRPRRAVYEEIATLSRPVPKSYLDHTRRLSTTWEGGAGAPPYLTEGWYCCAEPGPEQIDVV
jgi:radical SAM superfamily enzyme YgiQ (UPF0313 family)